MEVVYPFPCRNGYIPTLYTVLLQVEATFLVASATHW